MQTIRTRLNQAVLNNLRLIRAGFPIPGRTDTFNTDVQFVTRALIDFNRDKLPALYYESSSTTGEHLLADVRLETMRISVMGILAERQFLNNVVYAADQVDSLSDDVLAVLTRDTTWGGLALRTRILDSFLSPEINEPLAAVVRNLEIDYVELPGFAPVAVIPQGAVNINGQAFLAINPSDPARKQILDSLFNLFLGIQDIAWVESPNNWPVPNEQIPAVHTPGIFFSDSGETFEYRGSLDTLKIISLQTVLLALEPDPAQFEASKEAWVSALKLQLGDVADLRNLVNTVDILDIRTNQSKYPLIHLDVDLKVRYVQSFLAS